MNLRRLYLKMFKARLDNNKLNDKVAFLLQAMLDNYVGTCSNGNEDTACYHIQ